MVVQRGTASYASAERDPRFLKGIALFNRRRFFEAHEAWEEIWRELPGRKGESGSIKSLYQGLIQLAVTCHHLKTGNLKGARRIFENAVGYLKPFLPLALGINLKDLTERIGLCLADQRRKTFPTISL